MTADETPPTIVPARCGHYVVLRSARLPAACPRCAADRPARAADRTRRAARYAAKVAAGVCVHCPRPALPGRVQCAEHAAVQAERARAVSPAKLREYGCSRRARYAARTPEQVAAKRAEMRPGGLKRCGKCHEHLPFESFSADRTKADGLNYVCRMCANAAILRIAAERWADDDLAACIYCGGPFEHVDHVVPQAEGGPDTARNLVPACAACNTSKSADHVLDFVARRLGEDVVAEVLRWPVRVVGLDAA